MTDLHVLALDFDHTIIDGNSDVHIRKLVSDIPQEFVAQYEAEGDWTVYMQNIFEYLHKKGVDRCDYLENLQQLKLVHEMANLIRIAGQLDYFRLVVISDSNSVFIEEVLKFHNLRKFVDEIFTNPAHFDSSGCLQIRYYQTQEQCKLRCQRNMCKGDILASYLAELKTHNKNSSISRVIYVGDGTNDFCPAMRLQSQDMVFARKDYKLERLLKENNNEAILPQVHVWESAREILEKIME